MNPSFLEILCFQRDDTVLVTCSLAFAWQIHVLIILFIFIKNLPEAKYHAERSARHKDEMRLKGLP